MELNQMPRHLTDAQLAAKMIAMGQTPNFAYTKTRRKRSNVEHQHQKALIEWWHHAHTRFGVPEHLFFAVPNGGWRDPIGAKILKSEGQRNGVSDLMLAMPRGSFHGAFVEMKAPDGEESDAQQEFMKDVIAQGYAGRFCYSRDEAVKFVTMYLSGGL